MQLSNLGQPKPSDFLTPTSNNNPQKAIPLLGSQNNDKKGKKDDLFAQIQKGLNNDKLRKDDKGAKPEKKMGLLGQLNKKIADRKRNQSAASLKP